MQNPFTTENRGAMALRKGPVLEIHGQGVPPRTFDNFHHETRFSMNRPDMSFVTVVFSQELALLELQARSLAKFATTLPIRDILVLVNDCDQDRTAEQVRRICHLYGPLQDRVKILLPEDVWSSANRATGLKQVVRRHAALRPRLQMTNRKGWRRNDGWRMQQALKLAAVRRVSASNVVFLDAKNVFIRDLDEQDFLDPAGKPRTRFTKADKTGRAWLAASMRSLGPAPETVPETITQFGTPFCVGKGLLSDTLETLEAAQGPVQDIFAWRFYKGTEFMLINALCHKRAGGLEPFFADGLVRSYTIFAGHSGTLPDRILDDCMAHDGKCIGLHRIAMARAPNHLVDRIEALVTGQGIVTRKEFEQVLRRLRTMPGGTA